MDAYGNRDTYDNSTQVTVVACSTSASDASCTAATSALSGTTTQTASSGLATFTGLTYATPESIKFRATAAGGMQKASSSSAVEESTKITVSDGGAHGCVVIDGAAKCWGDNANGKLGDGNTTAQLTPVDVSGLSSGVANIYVGNDNTCALLTSGALKCWGENSRGQNGNGNTTTQTTPVQVTGLTSGVTAVAGPYWRHMCAIVNGGVKCWGYNGQGQLGNGSGSDSSVPVDVQGISSGATKVVIADTVSCAIQSGALKCWGENNSGQMGDGTTTNRSTPVTIFASGVTDVEAFYYSVCAVVDGGVKCMGYGGNGRLGDGTNNNSSTPVTAIAAGSGVVDIDADRNGTVCAIFDTGALKCWGSISASTPPITVLSSGVSSMSISTDTPCVILTTGAAKCWGSNSDGRVGDGTTTNRSSPTQVSGLTSGVTRLVGGAGYVCALVSGAVKCWGANSSGQLGVGDTTNRSSPSLVDLASLTTFSLGSVFSFYIKASTGKLYAWGKQTMVSSLGLSSVSDGSYVNVPTQVGTANWKAVSGGNGNGCGVQTDGTLWCWGDNAAPPPAQVGTDTNWAKVSGGASYRCAIKTTGTLWCWGLGWNGALGTGDTSDRSSPTQEAGGATNWKEVVATLSNNGGHHTCGIKADNTLWCWGYNNSYQLGDGTTTQRTSPTQIGSAQWKQVTIGSSHFTCGIRTTGTLWCWGLNTYGQLGIGNTTDQTSQTQVGSDTWKHISAGRSYACGIKTNGTLWCWGANEYGSVGDGTSTQRTSPVQVGSATDWQMVEAGGDTQFGGPHTCARKTDLSVYCWGFNDNGQLGIGTGGGGTGSLVPVGPLSFP